jgi:glutathione S-transferase
MYFVLTAWITLVALFLYVLITMKVSLARKQYEVKAPSVDGPPAFLRVMRVQANTVEQLVWFLPALWLCAVYLSDVAAALGGILWLIGRTIYAVSYYRDAAKRGFGFTLALVATILLMLGAAYGLIFH